MGFMAGLQGAARGAVFGLHLNFAERWPLAVVSEQSGGLLAAAHGTFQGGRVRALDVIATSQ
jgi:hypothetical protein